MSITCSRRLHFCAGHRVHGHENKCAVLHGHNYVLWVHARPFEQLDDIGRVIDFSVLKDKLGSWIDLNWDHKTILFKEDAEFIRAFKFTSQSPYLLPYNPTAENMAKYLLKQICPQLFETVEVFKITLYETENCYATAEL